MWRRREPEHKRPHYGRRFVIFLLFVIGLIWGSAFYLSPQDELVKSDVIVVVSGGQTTTRADEGIALYKAGWAPLIVFSGAALDDGPSNAAAMKEQAKRAGVPESAIVTDEAAQTTYQNATGVQGFVEDRDWNQLILVTSPYHQRRAWLTFRYVLGDDKKILNHSSFDNRWSKMAWWATPFGVSITGSELAKIIVLTTTGNYE